MTSPHKLPRERTHFKELLLLDGLKVADQFDHTHYEQLTCVGYEPDAKRLDATVNIKQTGGYSGGICTHGSQEYVKFFTSTNNGATWVERGVASFTVYDVPGPKPLEYAASLNVDLGAECCRYENIVLVRAILSWAVPPGGANDPVFWGNSLDAHIQVAPLRRGTWVDVIRCFEKVPLEELEGIVDPAQPVEFLQGETQSALQLHKAYAETQVQPHRYLFADAQELLASPVSFGAPGVALFPGIDIDPGVVFKPLLDPQGDRTYEQLGCLGLNENTAELVATIDVKLPIGYSGGICTAGSREYVAFWADFGAGYQYVGTTGVAVHDIASIPNDGLQYAVSLPFPQLYTHRLPCNKGPKTVHVRAVLSWQTPPSTTDPHAPVHWGGHLETTVLLPPGVPIVSGGGPHLDTIGNMAIGNIGAGGLANGVSASAPGFTATASPFGGDVWFSGHVINPGGGLGGPGISYRIMTSPDGVTYTPMMTAFTVETIDYLNGVTSPPIHQTPDPNGWYTCRENQAASLFVAGNTLGYVTTSGNGELYVYMEAKDASGPLGAPTVTKLIKLDNTAPVSSVWITSGAGSCGDFHVGDTIEGAYSTSDNEALGGIGFTLEPPPAAGLYTFSHVVDSSTPTSQSGRWFLDTLPAGSAGLDPCGYVLRFDGSDRTIVNSAYVGLDGPAFTGFCLKVTN